MSRCPVSISAFLSKIHISPIVYKKSGTYISIEMPGFVYTQLIDSTFPN